MHEAHNDTSSGTDESNYLIDRRDYLKATGASAAAFAGGLAATGTAAAEPTNTGSVSGSGYSTTDHGDYIEVTVGAGGHWSCNLDGGETLSNYLIDVSASGADYSINARSGDWTIRNVGIRGVYDASDDAPFIVENPNGGTGTIENVYLGDGTSNDLGSTTGIFVFRTHAGHIDASQLNIQGWADNAFYGSAPGNPSDHSHPGSDGTVVITDSYSKNNNISNYRLGTTGSYIKNCVAVDGGRGYWGYYQTTEVRDCDLNGGTNGSIAAGQSNYNDDAVINVTNSRYDSVHYHDSDATVNGSSEGPPSDYVPAGVPTSAEEAAKGDGSGGGGGSFTEVAEDFSHNDVPGTYSLDTGAFTTTSTRSTSDSYSIRADDSADDGKVILRDDMGTTAGNTYELDVYHQSGSDADMGFVFGAQSATSWSDYTGYFGFFDSNADEIRVDRWENGSPASTSATALTWPLDEWLTVELDYRDTDSSAITMTVFDAAGNQLGSVSLADTTYDSGTVGWYNYFAAADWFADSWFDASGGGGGSGTVVDDFEDGDLSEYSFDRGSSAASVVTSPTQGGSYALEYVDTNVEAISTTGLNAYPGAGDAFSFWVRASGGANNLNVTWGVQDHQNRYYAKLKPSDGSLTLFTYKSGSGNSKNSATGLSLSQDAWYEIEIDWATDGTQTATLYDSGGSQRAQISMSDSTWTSGGVGYDAYLSSGQAVYFDEVYVLDSSSSTTTVLDDFEDGDMAEYSGATDGYQVQGSTALEGSYSLEATTTYAKVAHANATTPRGYEYRCRVEAGSGSGAEPSLLTSVQDPNSPLQNCYFAHPDASAGEFKLVRRDSGSSTVLDSASFTFQEATEYEVALELGSGSVKAVLYDGAGSVIAETTTVSDSTHTGGNFGFYTGGGTPAYYDYVTKTSL